MTRFNENINNVIKNQSMGSIADKQNTEDSTWNKIKKVSPWVGAVGTGIGYLVGGPVGWAIGIGSAAIAAGSALTSCCKTIGKWLGI